jgi:ATP-dependent exoDNAse (exonuclease V) beta subunit
MEYRFKKLLSSAGGGKTHQLSARYKEILKQNKANLKRILAITFTNKAATEMKERILKIIKKDAIDRKDKYYEKLVDWILYNYSDFSVRTIDSFINKLIKVFSIELGLSPQSELILETDYYKDYAISKIIENIKDNKKLQKLIIEFLISMIEHEGKTYWGFKNIILNGMNEIENYENKLNIAFQIPHIEALETDRIMHNLLKKANNTITEILKIPGINESIKKYFLDSLIKARENINKLLRSKYLKGECDEIIKNNSSINQDDFCVLFNRLKNYVFEYYTHKIFRNYNYNINIYSDYKEILKEVKKEERIRFIEDINTELNSLFDEFDVPFIYYRIGERYNHFLIDEFQDTSRSQWKNLEPLIENSLSEGGSFFFVGDPKQAIYQWRGGEVKLFDEAFNSFSCVSEKEKIEKIVKINYRSGSEIVRFNNHVFSNLPDSLLEKIGENAKYYRDENVEQKPHYKNNFEGYIYLKKIANNSENKEDLEKAIKLEFIKTIREIKKRFRNGEIAILVRTNKQGKLVVDWLAEESIPIVSNESLYLSSDPNIKGFISFLKFLKLPIDDLSFFGFITSPFFLKETKKSFKEFKSWVEDKSFSIKSRNYNFLYEIFREEFNIIWKNYIEMFFRSVGFLPLYDLVCDVVRIFRIPENFPESNPFIEGFLEFIHNLEKKSITSIELMLNEWERAQSSLNPPSILLPDNINSIRVLTIHRAKGLEFPVVVIPFLYFGKQKGYKSRKEFIVEFEGVKRIGKLDDRKILPENDFNLKNKIKEELEKKEKEDTFEEINNIYVAMTRAKKELYVFIPEKIGQFYSDLWQQILESFVIEGDRSFGMKENGEADKELSEFIQIDKYGKESISEIENRLILKKTDIDTLINKKRKEALKLGEIVHRVLYYIKDINDLDNIEYIINRSLNELALPLERLFFKERIESLVKKIIEYEDIKKFFDPSLTVWREKEIVDRDGNLYRFDRVIFNFDTIILIDYKTGDEKVSSYKKQIQKYRDILWDYFPGKIIESYIIQLNTGEVISVE